MISSGSSSVFSSDWRETLYWNCLAISFLIGSLFDFAFLIALTTVYWSDLENVYNLTQSKPYLLKNKTKIHSSVSALHPLNQTKPNQTNQTSQKRPGLGFESRMFWIERNNLTCSLLVCLFMGTGFQCH